MAELGWTRRQPSSVAPSFCAVFLLLFRHPWVWFLCLLWSPLLCALTFQCMRWMGCVIPWKMAFLSWGCGWDALWASPVETWGTQRFTPGSWPVGCFEEVCWRANFPPWIWVLSKLRIQRSHNEKLKFYLYYFCLVWRPSRLDKYTENYSHTYSSRARVSGTCWGRVVRCNVEVGEVRKRGWVLLPVQKFTPRFKKGRSWAKLCSLFFSAFPVPSSLPFLWALWAKGQKE